MNNKVYLAIIGILIVVCAALGYKLTTATNTVETHEETIEAQDLEREKLEIELQRMLISYDTLSTQNNMLTAEMAAQRAEIEDLLSRVKNKDWELHKLKKEASTLRDIMKGYIVTIDSLNTLNDSLFAVSHALEQHVGTVTGENEKLSQKLQTSEAIIATGLILQTTSVASAAIRLRSSGKQIETTKASRAEMLKTCFTLAENRIAKPGNKNIYLSIIDPNGKVLLAKEGESELTSDDEVGSFSVKRTVDYNNSQMDVCIFYTTTSELAVGDYNIFIYEGGTRIGSTTLSLK